MSLLLLLLLLLYTLLFRVVKKCQQLVILPATVYFPSFSGYDSPVKRGNFGGKWCRYPLSAIYFPRFSLYLKSF